MAGGPLVRTALLLAAGLGSRLEPLTDTMPKCLVEVTGVPILERLVRALDAHGIERLVIFTGYRAEMIRDYLGESFAGIAVEYIESPLFATTNTLYSLWLARQAIDEPVLLVESDVVFDKPLLAPLLVPDRIAVSAQLPWMSGPTVTVDAAGRVNAIYPPAPGSTDGNCASPLGSVICGRRPGDRRSRTAAWNCRPARVHATTAPRCGSRAKKAGLVIVCVGLTR